MAGIKLALCVLHVCLLGAAWGAKRVDVRQLLQSTLTKRQLELDPTAPTTRLKRSGARLPLSELHDAMDLDDDTDVEVVQTVTSVQGTRLVKLQEKYKGQEVSDAVFTVELDGEEDEVVDATGTVLQDIHLDDTRSLSSDDALELCMAHNKDQHHKEDVINHHVTLTIAMDNDTNEAYERYMAQYEISHDDQVRRPTCLVDGRDSSIIRAWDALDMCLDCAKAKGTGGNTKIGKIKYGELQRCLDVREENGICYLENKYVRVINNNHSWSLYIDEDEDGQVAGLAYYDCQEIDDETNGAYSPLLDAFFYGTVIARMYEDWYGINPFGGQLTFRVHFGWDYVNAFWDGQQMTFGDGDGYYMYPLVSLDIASHEVGHGITERNSDLYYYHMWGGINEAFSDIAGEAAEAYLSDNDWVTGYDVMYEPYPPLRFFEDPTMDNVSIAHVDDFYEWIDPHFSSGVFNHVFWQLVHEWGLPIKNVFHVFLHANRMYWHHMSDYYTAACDVFKSAYDLGQDWYEYWKAFQAVGIEVCYVEDHVLGLRQNTPHSGIWLAPNYTAYFAFGVMRGYYVNAVNVTAFDASGQGNVHIEMTNHVWGDYEYDTNEFFAEGDNFAVLFLPNITDYHVFVGIKLSSDTELSNVTIIASYGYTDPDIQLGTTPSPTTPTPTEGPDGGDGGTKTEGGEGGISTTTVSGHVFNFFKSIVIMVFPQSPSSED